MAKFENQWAPRRPRRQFLRIAALAGGDVTGATLLACAPQKPAGPQSSAQSSNEAPKPGGMLNVAEYTDVGEYLFSYFHSKSTSNQEHLNDPALDAMIDQSPRHSERRRAPQGLA